MKTIFDSEYHRRRAETELDLALTASPLLAAVRHLELAKMHREERDRIAQDARRAVAASPRRFDRTDKES